MSEDRSLLVVPDVDEEPWPTLGRQVCELIEERCVFGPGSLKGQPAVIDDETRGLIYRAYEIYPRGHPREGRRRFNRVGWSMRKGSAKTEKMAWVAFAELHPDAEVRFDGWDAHGEPVGRPVAYPYIPLIAFSLDQVEELAYGALYVMCTEGSDSHLFDATLDRIVRLDERGRNGGEAKPLATAPNSRDGARTTFQGFDEPHRLTLPNHLAAHETMLANMTKRALEQPWSLYVGTAGMPGQESVAEQVHQEAEAIERGDVERPRLSYFHRQARACHDLTSFEGRRAAVIEASSPHVLTFTDVDDIAEQWDRPKADLQYLERVWLNRWTQAAAQAFDVDAFADLARPGARIPRGAFVTFGFDGARFRDAAGIVVTDISTGLQELWGRWEKRTDDDYEVDPGEVTESVKDLFARFRVWKGYCDPPHFLETIGDWEARWPDQVLEWWTNRRRPMSEAYRAYREAVEGGQLAHGGDADLVRHVGNAGKRRTNLRDPDTGDWVYILGKLHEDRKFDFAMAAVLSWRARLDAIKSGAEPPQDDFVPARVY